MIPIKDENPTRHFPIFTMLLLAANLAAYGWEVAQGGSVLEPLGSPALRATVEIFSLIPARLSALEGGPPDWPVLGPFLTLISSTFLHANLQHLLGNMLYLWIFGNNVEDVMGSFRFLVFYFLCGTVAALSQVAANPLSTVPMIGASGAIAGVLGAYLVRFPRARVLVLVWLFIFVRVVRVPALIMLGIWFGFQLLAVGRGGEPGVAWHAHVGGFVAGALLLHLFAASRRRH